MPSSTTQNTPLPPQSVLTGAKWWKYAVYTYIASLALTLVANLLMLDTLRELEIEAMTQQGLEATDAQVTTAMWVSMGTWLMIPAIGAAAAWFLSNRLLDRSTAARMLLSILSVVFVIMGAMAAFRYVTGTPVEAFGDSLAGAVFGLGIILSVVAPVIGAVATFMTYRDLMPDGKRYFV